jgi:multidrug efflux system outer membrane protein
MKAWAGVVLATAVAGCTVGPDYRRPAITSPPAFRSASVSASDAASLADLKWFEVFKDTRLQELVRTALDRNHDLREAAARVDAARTILGITRADQFPTIEAGAAVTAVRSSTGGAVALPQGVDQTRTFGTLSVGLLSYELDVWGTDGPTGRGTATTTTRWPTTSRRSSITSTCTT